MDLRFKYSALKARTLDAESQIVDCPVNEVGVKQG